MHITRRTMLSLLPTVLLLGAAPPPDGKLTAPAASLPAASLPAASLYDLSANLLDGKPQQLSSYRSKVLLVVNTASKCGFTPQYEGLEKLYQQYRDKGFVILGFPSNDFGAQEPGTAKEIATFCKTRYGVTFPLFEKIKTHGPEVSPVFRFLTAKHDEPRWNFFKYLVGKDGQVIQVFPGDTKPDNAALRSAIEAAIGINSP